MTLYRIPKSVCLLSQVASPVFNKNASFFANEQTKPSYKSLLSLNFLLLENLEEKEKKKLIFQAPFLLLPLVKYSSCSVINFNNISKQFNLAAFFVQGESQEGGTHPTSPKACFWRPAFALFQASPPAPLLLQSVRTTPPLWPTSAVHPHV